MKKQEKLIELRLKNNYTCDDMAKILGVSKSYYWKIENCKRNLYYDMAKKISKVFNLKPDDIFFDENQK